LIKSSNFVKTAIAAAALGFVAMGAQAVTLSGSAKYAVELFGGTAPQTAITLPNLQITAATAIPAGSTVTVMVQFVGGRPATQPAGTSGAVTAGGTITPTVGTTFAGATGAAMGVTTPTTAASNADIWVYKIVTDTSIGIGGNLLTVTAPTITAAGLATVGSTVTANVSLFVGGVTAPVGAAVPTTGLLEASSGATTVATSTQGVTLTGTAGSTSQQINTSAATPNTVFTTSGTPSTTDTGVATKIQLGTYGQVNGTGNNAGGAVPYTVAQVTAGGNTSAVITAPAGYFAAMGTAGSISLNTPGSAGAGNNISCAYAPTAATFAFASKSAAAAATKVTLATTALAATTGGATPFPYHVCETIDGTIPLQTGAASLTATLGQTASQAQDSTDSLAATTLATLANSGASTYVKSYFPNALSSYGYASFVRVVNTGAVSAPVSVAVVDPITGLAGTSGVLGTVNAGGATTFTAAQVEGVIGTQVITARPRLLVTGPTGSLQVQSFLQAPNGTVSEVSSTN